MRNFRKIAVSAAAVGAVALGTMAGFGGVANAAPGPCGPGGPGGGFGGFGGGPGGHGGHGPTQQSVTGCDLPEGLLVLGLIPTCTSPDSTVKTPTSVTITADPAFFRDLSNNVVGNLLESVLGGPLGEHVTYTLDCVVDGHSVDYAGHFDATDHHQSQVIDLQQAVGSPIPNSCTVEHLQATALIGLKSVLLQTLEPVLHRLGLGELSFGVSATANTGVPGAIWAETGKNDAGVNADICVDDAANGNHGSNVQVYQCNSDLAQYWTQSENGQLVHNGDCMDVRYGNKVTLDSCTSHSAEQWKVNGTGGEWGTIVNRSTGQCLTAASVANFSTLTVSNCDGDANQQFTAPAKSFA
jgi:hypothetical protein